MADPAERAQACAQSVVFSLKGAAGATSSWATGSGEYTTLAGLSQRGVDGVARLHQRRKVDFRKARRLGKNDGLFVWKKKL